MPSPAFLVDGHLEQKVVQRICPDSVVRRLQCNGDNVALDAIAKRVTSHCRLLGGKHYPLLVVIDREERQQSAEAISAELLALIKAEGITDIVVIGVADRNIENWIIADTEMLMTANPGISPSWGSVTDGFDGKAQLKRVLGAYHETTTGVNLLLNCRPSTMKEASPSFNNFLQQITLAQCHWLHR